MTVNVKTFQQQTDGVDCGVLAASNMFHILTGADIGRTKIQEDKMRDHLLQCIKSGHFQELEKSDSSNIVFCKIKKIKFQIFFTADFLGNRIITMIKIRIRHVLIRTRNVIIPSIKTYQTLFSMKNLILIGIVLVA